PARQIAYLTTEISVELIGRGCAGICALHICCGQQFPSVLCSAISKQSVSLFTAGSTRVLDTGPEPMRTRASVAQISENSRALGLENRGQGPARAPERRVAVVRRCADRRGGIAAVLVNGGRCEKGRQIVDVSPTAPSALAAPLLGLLVYLALA